MLTATPEVVSYLNATTQGGPPPLLVTITLHDGTVLRWVNRSTSLTFGGTTWLPHGQSGRPLFSLASPIRAALGLEISTTEILLQCGDEATIGGKKLPQFAAQGGFRGARLKLERAILPSREAAVLGVVPRFAGTIQSAPGTSTTVKLVVESDVAVLSRPFPTTLLTAACGNALGDAACGVDLEARKMSVVATGTPTRSTLYAATGQGLPAVGFALGTVTITSGALAGQVRSIRRYTYGTPITIEVSPPFPVAPEPGVEFTLRPGCDLTGATCLSRFNNLARWRGVANLPREEGLR